MLCQLHMIVESLFTEVTREGFVLFLGVGVDDVDVEVLLHLKPFAAVLAQVVVECGMHISVVLLLQRQRIDL